MVSPTSILERRSMLKLELALTIGRVKVVKCKVSGRRFRFSVQPIPIAMGKDLFTEVVSRQEKSSLINKQLAISNIPVSYFQCPASQFQHLKCTILD